MNAAAMAALLIQLAGPECRRPCQARANALAPILAAQAGAQAPLLASMAWVESSYRKDAVSRKGALGPWQLAPTGWARHLCKRLKIERPSDNLKCAMRLLERGQQTCGDDGLTWYWTGSKCGPSWYSRKVLGLVPAERNYAGNP